MKDIELPPLPDLLEKAIVHFAQACLYSEAESRRASAEHLKSEVKAYARAAVEANSVPDGPPYYFQRFVNGLRMAEDIEIHLELSLEKAMKKAARICPPMKGTVLVLSASPAPAQQERKPTLPPGHCASDWGGRPTGPCLYTDDEVLQILAAHGIKE